MILKAKNIVTNSLKIKVLHIIFIILLLIPPLVLATVFWKYAVNIPHWDDHALKAFQVNYNKSDDFFEKIRLIFAQHNEHRITLTRLFSLIIYKIKGTIDYRWLMILGNLSLLGIASILFLIFKKYKIYLIYFLPVSCLFFGLQLHANLFWGMASVQNFWVVFLAILTFYLLLISEKKSSFYWAIFTAFWAVFTSQNGLLVPIIGIIILLFQYRKKELIYWLSSICVFIFAYFYNFTKSPDSEITNVALSNWKILPKGLVIFFATMADSTAILPQKRDDLAMTAGLILSLFGILFFRETILEKYKKDKNIISLNEIEKNSINLFFLAILMFIVGTGIGVVYSRLGFGINVLFDSKYKIYSTLFFIIFYLVSVNSLKNKAQKLFGFLAISGGILFNFYSYFADYQQVTFTKQERICDEFNWTYNAEPNELSPSEFAAFKAVFKPEKQFYEDNLTNLLSKTDTLNLDNSVFEIKKDSNNLTVSSKVSVSTGNEFDTEYFFVIKSKTNFYIYPIRNPFYKTFKIVTTPTFSLEFLMEIPKTNFKTNNYQLGILIKKGESLKLYFSPQLIDIQGVTSKNVKKNW